jgi:hypothetical protein
VPVCARDGEPNRRDGEIAGRVVVRERDQARQNLSFTHQEPLVLPNRADRAPQLDGCQRHANLEQFSASEF